MSASGGPSCEVDCHGMRLAVVDGVRAAATFEAVVAWSSTDGVVPAPAMDAVVVALSSQTVAAPAAIEDVDATVSVELVVEARTDQVLDLRQGV